MNTMNFIEDQSETETVQCPKCNGTAIHITGERNAHGVMESFNNTSCKCCGYNSDLKGSDLDMVIDDDFYNSEEFKNEHLDLCVNNTYKGNVGNDDSFKLFFNNL